MGSVTPNGLVAHNQVVAVLPSPAKQIGEKQSIDYLERAQWLRAAVLGANDGLVSVASMMMGIGAVKRDAKAMLLAGFTGLVAGACGMAIGEFVSVYNQYDVEFCQMKRNMEMSVRGEKEKDLEMEMEMEMKKRALPNPWKATLASALSFSVGALVPLLSAAFIADYKIRVIVILAMTSLASVIFGSVGAHLGKTPKVKSCVRFLLGAWIAMSITFGLTKLMDVSAL
ncbi:hypothetical protein VNO78_11472 [Psophocarpus tetragonolobus]|uniref:Vacuolar iron transporter n=1 Tax=Psophocarpus tetragonolobus TaxID=3891 RepID=A0AAN9XN76_PSOTE